MFHKINFCGVIKPFKILTTIKLKWLIFRFVSIKVWQPILSSYYFQGIILYSLDKEELYKLDCSYSPKI